jgi:mono/diheme cytochrome c family protein
MLPQYNNLMSTQSNLVKCSRIYGLMGSVVALLTFACLGGSTAAADSLAEKWLSPAPSAAKKNPVASTENSIAAGQKIYSKTCMMCHGKTGDADGPAVIELNIHPAKLSDPQLNTEPDGALFWKITTGKKPMPAYGKRLSETDRWNLINYIRTLPKH